MLLAPSRKQGQRLGQEIWAAAFNAASKGIISHRLAIRGVADAKATEIYSKAYNQSPEAVAFYEFTRTMQSYKSIIAENTTLVISTGSDLFKFLKGMTPDGDAK